MNGMGGLFTAEIILSPAGNTSPLISFYSDIGVYVQSFFDAALHPDRSIYVPVAGIALAYGALHILWRCKPVLRLRARLGSISALTRLTQKAVRRNPGAALEADELIPYAFAGQDWAMFTLFQKLGSERDRCFLQDKALAHAWLLKAAACDNPDACETLREMHAQKGPAAEGPTDRDPMEELDAMIGLDNLKKSVRDIASRAKLFEKREAAGLTASHPALHIVFMGNPGTGKTVIARIIGRILKKTGYLERGHVVETAAADLIGQFVGETPQKVQQAVMRALDGVLFIDEAYAITGFNTGGGGSFGAEAVTTLLKLMEDNRDRLVVIAAGYPNEMQSFLEANPGFRSRFTDIIHFDDYSAEDLVKIYCKLAKEQQYALDSAAQTALLEVMKMSRQIFAKNFANGRFVRNIFEATIKHLAARVEERKLTSKADLSLILAEDVVAAFAEENQRRNPGSALKLDIAGVKPASAKNIVDFHKKD